MGIIRVLGSLGFWAKGDRTCGKDFEHQPAEACSEIKDQENHYFMGPRTQIIGLLGPNTINIIVFGP